MKQPDTELIELKIAYLERANIELSDTVYRQQQELDALRLQLSALASRVDSLKPEAEQYTAEQERPPHY
jgi:SlyX protein